MVERKFGDKLWITLCSSISCSNFAVKRTILKVKTLRYFDVKTA